MPAEVFVNADWAGLPNGTEVGPGQVIGDNAFGTVQAGVDAVDAGGTVHVAAGVYNERVFILGPEKAGITVRGELNAILDGTGFGTNDRGFSISADGVTIEGFIVRHYPQSYGVFITDCHDVTLRGNTIVDNGLGPSGFRGGVYVRGSTNLLLEGNVVENNHNDGVVLDWGVYGAVVRNNTFRKNRNVGLFVGGTGGTAPTSKATVEANLFEENGSGVATPEDPTSFSIPGHAGVVVWDAGVLFRRNTLHNNNPDGLVWIHFDAERWEGSQPDPAFNSLEQNSFQNHPRHAILLFTLVSTFIQPLGPVDPPAAPNVLRNNILGNGGNGLMAVGSSNPRVEFNRIAGNGAGLVNTWAGATIGGIFFPPVTVTAVNNWWGDSTGPFHPTLNPAGQGNLVSDRVLFDPWLTQDPAEEVTPNAIHRLVHAELTAVQSPPSSPVRKLYSTGPLENGAFSIAARSHAVYIHLMNNSPLVDAEVTVMVWNLGVSPKAPIERRTVVIHPLEAETLTVSGLEGVARFEVQLEVSGDTAAHLLMGAFGGTVDQTETIPVPIHRLVSSEWTALQPPFSPADISGLVAWYDAAALDLSEGDPVAVWPDASGNGHHARQDDPGFQPTFRTAVLNNRPVVEFHLDFLRTSLFPEPLTQPVTAFAVWRLVDDDVPGAVAFRKVFDGIGSSFGLEWRSTVPTGVRMAAPQGIVGPRGPVDAFIVSSCVYDATNAELYENGALRAAGGVGRNPLDGITIGAAHNDARKLMGQIAELIVYESRLTQEQRAQVERYLLAKWGITPSNGEEPPLQVVYSTGVLANAAFGADARSHVVFVDLHNNDAVHSAQATVTVFDAGAMPKEPVAPPQTITLAPLQTAFLSFPSLGSISAFEIQIEITGASPHQVLAGVFGGVAPFGAAASG